MCVLCIFHSSSSTLLFLLLILCLCLFSFLYLFAQFANATFSLIQTIMICINNAPICDSASDNCLTNNKINSAPFEIHNVQSKSNYIHLNQSNQIIFYQVKFKERSQSNSKMQHNMEIRIEKSAAHFCFFFVIFFFCCAGLFISIGKFR